MLCKHENMIGVVGGVGPYAGVDLVTKIFDQTEAGKDQEHLPVVMLSLSQTIPDRTEFLLERIADNPSVPLAAVIDKLHSIGATVVGIPCNTAHARRIFDDLRGRIPHGVELLHMIEEVARFIRDNYPQVSKVGVLSTTGTWTARIYPDNLTPFGLVGVQVSEQTQTGVIHPSIYAPEYGIKARSNPVTSQAREALLQGAQELVDLGAEVIVSGCTEIPLALTEDTVAGVPLIDATRVLARALILKSFPEQLKA